MYNFIRLCLDEDTGRVGLAGRRLLAAGLVAAMCLVAFSAIDRFSVQSFIR
jgi:hypothetical protein